jgi:hypothetical protein
MTVEKDENVRHILFDAKKYTACGVTNWRPHTFPELRYAPNC